MDAFIRKYAPEFLLVGYRRCKAAIKRFRDRRKTPEQIFSEIYANNRWGGRRGEFYSGDGSHLDGVVSPYVSMVFEQAAKEDFSGLKFVDLGCGDFNVGAKLLPLCSSYTGVDVVSEIIQRNIGLYGNENVHFVQMDIVNDELPSGDVCFIRQVLQHLSNQQIDAILVKLKKYRFVFITEHYPRDGATVIPNKDKVHGADFRLYSNSGVYLTEPPFGIPAADLRQVLEVPGTPVAGGLDPGVIRTFLYKPLS